MCQIRWENDCVLTSVSLCQEVFSVVCLNLHLSCARICHAMYVDILEGHKLLHIYLSHNPEQGIWSGTPWSGSIQKSMAFWIAGLERHSNYWSADCKLMWSVTWHSKRLHSRCLSAQIDCRESQLFPLEI